MDKMKSIVAASFVVMILVFCGSTTLESWFFLTDFIKGGSQLDREDSSYFDEDSGTEEVSDVED